MKFVKGMVVGGIISTGAYMLMTDKQQKTGRKKVVKMGKQFAKKMGMM